MSKLNKQAVRGTESAVADSVQRMVGLLPPKRDYAYRMGFDCGKNGANTTNCSFAIFSSPANTRRWEMGKRDAEQQANDPDQRPARQPKA